MTAVAAGGLHSVALKSDGTVVCWGGVLRAPARLANVVAISASCLDACAVTAGGEIAVWGRGLPRGSVWISAKTPGLCGVLSARIVDRGIYMALVRAPEGSLEGDADGDGIPGLEEVFFYGTDPAMIDADFAGLENGPEASGENKGLPPAPLRSGLRSAGAPAMGVYGLEGSATYYADASRSDDSGDGLSLGTAKRTIQAAVDLASDGDTVVVTNGVYGEGARAAPGSALTNRLVVTNAVLVRSVGGAGVTSITGSGAGAFDSDDAVRCVYMLDGVLDGFTLTGGATLSFRSYETAVDCGGGALCMIGSADGTEVRNCVIRDSAAYNGGGAVGHYGSEVRGLIANCLIVGNTATYGGAAYRGGLMNSTLAGNSAGMGGAAFYCGVTNSVACGNGEYWNGEYWENDPCYGSEVGYSCAVPQPQGVGNLGADPLFADPANGDFSLQSGSPCIDAGSNACVTAETDLAGNPRIQGAAVDMGAFEMPPTDSDGDGVPDFQDAFPQDKAAWIDTDSDGMPDELHRELNENTTLVEDTDDDNDGLPDGWESKYSSYGFDPLVPAPADSGGLGLYGDPDGDGLGNLAESARGTDPFNPDTDYDGMPDGWEAQHGLNPLSGMAAGLAGWWQFREGSGASSADLSGNGNGAHILFTNRVAWSAAAPLGAALHFDADESGAPPGYNGGYVCVPGLSNAPTASGFTVAAWVRADSFPFYATILTRSSDHEAWADGFSLYHETGDSLALYAGDWSSSRATSGAGGTGTWTHVCGACDGTNAALYINGRLCGTVSNITGSVASADPLWIGTTFFYSRWLCGQLRDRSLDKNVIDDSIKAAQYLAMQFQFDKAMDALVPAFHAIQDSYSPVHVGLEGPIEFFGGSQYLLHGDGCISGETTDKITSEKLDGAKRRMLETMRIAFEGVINE